MNRISHEDALKRLNSSEFTVNTLWVVYLDLSMVFITIGLLLRIIPFLLGLISIIGAFLLSLVLAHDMKRIDKELGIKYDE